MDKTTIILAVGGSLLVGAVIVWRFGWLSPDPAPGTGAAVSAPAAGAPSVHYQSRADFGTFMKLFLPKSMCDKPETYFRSCYLVTHDQCLETAEKVIDECLATQADKIGPIVKAGEDMKYWQTMTGRCAGKFYSRDLAKYLKEEDACVE